MRIAIIASISETLLLLQREQIALLVSKGHQVHCIAAPLSWFKQEEIPGATFHPVPFQRKVAPFSDLRCFAQLIFLFLSFRPDAICYSTPKAAFLASCAGFVARVPRRIYLHRGILYCLGRAGEWIFRLLDLVACFFSHMVISASESNRKFLIKNRICAADKVRLLGKGSSHGVHAREIFNPEIVSRDAIAQVRARFDIREDDIVAGFVGRMVRDKGIIELVDALRMVSAESDRIHLLIVGPDIEPRDRLPESCIDAVKKTKIIHLAGSQREMALWYAAMDFLVLPSHREGFPNAVLEAAAMEKPAIASDSLGCIDSVVDEKTGLIFRVGDAKALAGKMRMFINDRNARVTMGKNARQRVLRDFDPEIINREFVQVIEGCAVEKSDNEAKAQ